MNKFLSLFFRYFAACAVFILLYLYLDEKGSILSNITQFNTIIIAPVILFISVHIYLLIIVWKTIVAKVGGIQADRKQILHSFFGGRTLGFLTPGQTGELLKGLFFQENSKKQITGLSFIFAGYGMLIRLVLGSVGALYFLLYYSVQYMSPENPYFKWTIQLLILLVIIGWIGWRLGWWRNFITNTVFDFWCTLKSQLLSNSKKQAGVLLLISLLANLIACFAFLTLLNGFSEGGYTLEGFLAFEAAYFTMLLLPVTPAGLGIREGSRVYFFTLIGYDAQIVFFASVIMFVLNIGIPAMIGIPSLRYIQRPST